MKNTFFKVALTFLAWTLVAAVPRLGWAQSAPQVGAAEQAVGLHGSLATPSSSWATMVANSDAQQVSQASYGVGGTTAAGEPGYWAGIEVDLLGAGGDVHRCGPGPSARYFGLQFLLQKVKKDGTLEPSSEPGTYVVDSRGKGHAPGTLVARANYTTGCNNALTPDGNAAVTARGGFLTILPFKAKAGSQPLFGSFSAQLDGQRNLVGSFSAARSR